jgi:hypothetical protein
MWLRGDICRIYNFIKSFKIFVLSILVFPTLSFLSIFDDLAKSIYRNDAPNIDVEFPFTYYELFFFDHPDLIMVGTEILSGITSLL